MWFNSGGRSERRAGRGRKRTIPGIHASPKPRRDQTPPIDRKQTLPGRESRGWCFETNKKQAHEAGVGGETTIEKRRRKQKKARMGRDEEEETTSAGAEAEPKKAKGSKQASSGGHPGALNNTKKLLVRHLSLPKSAQLLRLPTPHAAKLNADEEVRATLVSCSGGEMSRRRRRMGGPARSPLPSTLGTYTSASPRTVVDIKISTPWAEQRKRKEQHSTRYLRYKQHVRGKKTIPG